MRYEAAVETNLTFHTQEPPFADELPAPETVVIEFEGRRFVWHALGPGEEGHERWPTVTTMVANPNDYDEERRAMERFLSVLSYWTHQPIEVGITGGAGWPGEMDAPVVTGLRRGLADGVFEAPAELVVTTDDRLRRVLRYRRDGLNTNAPFFKFLAFWNALDVACEDYAGGLRGWIQATMPAYANLWRGDGPAPQDWWDYLQNERRSAVAHAVRDPGRGPDIDPDDPADRGKFYRDARLLDDLIGIRIRERWGNHPVYQRRRQSNPT